jgi:hypothetical protein
MKHIQTVTTLNLDLVLTCEDLALSMQNEMDFKLFYFLLKILSPLLQPLLLVELEHRFQSF